MNAISEIEQASSFSALRARYEAALAAERAHDAIAMPGGTRGFVSAEAEEESDRLTDSRYEIEDEMMKVPSPDASAFAFKYLVAHGDGRDTDCWDAMLEAEAKSFAARPSLATGAEWAAALTDYEVKRKVFEDWDHDADNETGMQLCDAWCTAMDHLVENVRAPNVEAAIFKMKLAKERWDGFTMPDEWLDAFAADIRHLCTPSPDPHMGWLAERDALLREANTRKITDNECTEIVNRSMVFDHLILDTPATTTDGILAKSLIVVGGAAANCNIAGAAERVFADAKALGLVEYEA